MSSLLIEVGATHTRARVITNTSEPIFEKVYETSKFKSSTDLVKTILTQSKTKKCDLIALAIAGPHSFDSIIMTHTKLVFTASELEQQFKTKIFLCNDVYSQALALSTSSFKSIYEGYPQGFTKVVISIGTGLGVACTYQREGKLVILSTEAGHSLFAGQTEEDELFCDLLKKRLNKHFIEWEDILSGKGLESLYFFLSGKEDTIEKISSYESTDLFAKKTFELFSKYVAKFSQQCALEYLAQGGIYLSGGVIAKHSQFSISEFRKNLCDHDSFKQLLKDIPINITQNDFLGLEGLASVALSK